MALVIPRDQISEDKAKLIRELLTLSPIEDDYSNPMIQNYYKEEVETEPVIFFNFDRSKNVVYLPFTLGTTLFPEFRPPLPMNGKSPFNFVGNLLEHQVSIVDEAITLLRQNHTTLLEVFPGCGKTVMAAKLASLVKLDKPLILVLIHLATLQPQWLNTFAEFTDAKVWVVGSKTTLTPDTNVIICMERQFDKISTDVRERVGFLIVDEAHAFCTKGRAHTWIGTQPHYTLALSATPERADGMHSMIHAVVGLDKVFRPFEKKHLVYRFGTRIQPPLVKRRDGRIDWQKLVRYLCENELRNEYLFGFIDANPEFKIGVVTWSYDHAVFLHDELKRRQYSVAILAGNKKTYSDSSILIGTIAKIGTGFDEKTACPDFGGQRINMLIMMGTTRSEPLIQQILGRAFRAQVPHIVVFVDEASVTKNHWYVIRKWCMTHGGEIHEMSAPRVQETANDGDKKTQPVPQTRAEKQLAAFLEQEQEQEQEGETNDNIGEEYDCDE